MDIQEKLKILAAGAKYDVSCSSSGSSRSNKSGLGRGHRSGICHSWSEDGRCISLLKILLSNKCTYNCQYCINRRDNDISRAEFTPEEVCDLVVNFYKRNYIEGLFLSSAVTSSPDQTMVKLIRVAELLRNKENFNGYIHMKAIPGASDVLINKLASLVDRMSINIELAREDDLASLAPDKSYSDILRPMNTVRESIDQYNEDKKKYKSTPLYLPAGQSTQMIIGASEENDLDIMTRTESLYNKYSLKRVFYSAYLPVVQSDLIQSLDQAPLQREHRLYQADWLLRFYNFKSHDLLTKDRPNLDLDLDPKANWAIENYDLFPLEINTASYEDLIRIPGIGKKYAWRIINARRLSNLSFYDLHQLKISLKRPINFITVGGRYKGLRINNKEDLRNALIGKEKKMRQLSFFD